jgi:secondary thiamine-phosphate synthase enzyme
MSWFQTEITLIPKRRGFHLITDEIVQAVPQLRHYHIGLAHNFIHHTSASLTINENADPTVRYDMETFFNRTVPEEANLYQHTYEGLDDMTSHIKASLLGTSVTVPIHNGRFRLGTWQGIYLCEHRHRARARRLIITLNGETNTAE